MDQFPHSLFFGSHLPPEEIFSIERLAHAVEKGPFLGIDWGKKRVGLALSDSENRLAMPFRVVSAGGPLRGALTEIWKGYNLKALVIGWPLHLKGQPGSLCPAIERLVLRIQQDHGWPICLWDERLSSHAAAAMMLDRKREMDHHAAAVILQGALDRWRHLRS